MIFMSFTLVSSLAIATTSPAQIQDLNKTLTHTNLNLTHPPALPLPTTGIKLD